MDVAEAGQRPEEGPPGFFEDGIAQTDIEPVQLSRSQPGPDAGGNDRTGGGPGCQPEYIMYRCLEMPLQHGKSPRDDYAPHATTVYGNGHIFSEGFHFASL